MPVSSIESMILVMFSPIPAVPAAKTESAGKDEIRSVASPLTMSESVLVKVSSDIWSLPGTMLTRLAESAMSIPIAE